MFINNVRNVKYIHFYVHIYIYIWQNLLVSSSINLSHVLQTSTVLTLFLISVVENNVTENSGCTYA